MPVLPPYTNIDYNWSSAYYPPDSSDNYFVRYFEKAGSHLPYKDINENLKFNIPAGQTGTAILQSQASTFNTLHHTLDGSLSSHHAIAIFGPNYATNIGTPGDSNVSLIWRMEGKTGGKWMQIRWDILYASDGEGNGEANVYFEDSEGFSTDHITLVPGFPISQYEQHTMYFYLYADGTCTLRMYSYEYSKNYQVNVTSNLLAAGEQYDISLTLDVKAAQTFDQAFSALTHDVNMIVYGIWTGFDCDFATTDQSPVMIGNNEEVVPMGGFLYHNMTTVGIPAWDWDEWELYWEYVTDYDPSVTEDPTIAPNSESTTVNYDYQNPMWHCRSRFAVPWQNSYFYWHTECLYRGYPGLTNADGSKYLRMGYSSGRLGIWWNGGSWIDPESPQYYSETSIGQHQKITGWFGIVSFYVWDGSGWIIQDIDLRDYFDPGEEIFFQVFITSVNYDYFRAYSHWEVRSVALPPNPDYGQGSGASMFCEMQNLDVPNEWTTAQDEYVMYYRTKIFNPEDYDDEQSLKAIDPHYPSDIGFALRERDACIVKDQYNRWYFYQVVPGDEVDDLPHKMRITDQVYWKLIDYTGQDPRYKVEQYDVVGLVSGNSVLVTHTEHDTSLSPAPCFQIIHDGRVKTDEIIVTLVSSTQLRLTTEVATAFTDLKINIYLTAAP